MKKLLKRIYRNKFTYIAILMIAAVIFGSRQAAERKKSGTLITFNVQRQDMNISVIEGGNLVALISQKIVNNVPGNRTVLEAIEDGTHIKEEDIEKGLVLLKMDSKDLEERKERLTLDVENSWASYMEAEQRLEIQKKQNESDITQAELKLKFAEMDIKKYLGDEFADLLIKSEIIDISSLPGSKKLGGEALNRVRQLTNNIDIAKEQVTRAKDKVNWSNRLAEKGYITQSELEADLLSLKQREVELERAQLEYQLFLDYDFAKDVEKYISDYNEFLSELERVKANCRAKLIQAESSLQSREVAYRLNKNSLAEVEEHIENCTIKATQPGFVTTPVRSRWRAQEPIQPGTLVRMYQTLFVIPDFRSMGVEVSVHEASIRKLSAGQKAAVRVDAFPETSLAGRVTKIAHMPDPVMQFMNPDLNVYITRVALDGIYDYLRPGMSAQVEIFIKELKDVIAVPVDAVLFKGERSYCVVLQGHTVVEREIEIGESSDTLVEVKKGLDVGETIVMQPRMVASQVKKMEIEEKGKFEEIGSPEAQPPVDSGEAPSMDIREPSGSAPRSPSAERGASGGRRRQE